MSGGLGLTDRQFWLLTPVEFAALKVRYEAAHGIKPTRPWYEERAEIQNAPGGGGRFSTVADQQTAIDQLYRSRCAAHPRLRRPRG